MTILAMTDWLYNLLSKHGYRMVRCKTTQGKTSPEVTKGVIVFKEPGAGTYRVTIERIS